MELRQLRYFLAVADAGSFTAAAAVLHMTQPPLSVQIGQLEKDLGVQLFLRMPGGVVLTSEGKRLYPIATQVMAQLANLPERIRDASSEPSVLRGAYPMDTSPTVLSRARQKLDELAPGVKVDFHERPTDSQLRLLESGEIDFGIIRLPVKSSSLVLGPVLERPIVAVFRRTSSALPERIPIRSIPFAVQVVFPRRAARGHFDWLNARLESAGYRPQRRETAIALIDRILSIEDSVTFVPSDQSPAHDEIAVALLDPPLHIQTVVALRPGMPTGLARSVTRVLTTLLLDDGWRRAGSSTAD